MQCSREKEGKRDKKTFGFSIFFSLLLFAFKNRFAFRLKLPTFQLLSNSAKKIHTRMCVVHGAERYHKIYCEPMGIEIQAGMSKYDWLILKPAWAYFPWWYCYNNSGNNFAHFLISWCYATHIFHLESFFSTTKFSQIILYLIFDLEILFQIQNFLKLFYIEIPT